MDFDRFLKSQFGQKEPDFLILRTAHLTKSGIRSYHGEKALFPGACAKPAFLRFYAFYRPKEVSFMKYLAIRGCRIGEGRPKVILPIVEQTEGAILEKAAQFSTWKADCVEWRVDLFADAQDLSAVARCAAKLRVALKNKLLLITFRTKAEGGHAALSHEEYRRYFHTVLDTDCADLIDLEFFTAGADLPGLITDAHTAGAAVICSSHDFQKTPPKAELVDRMVRMQQAGADLPKLAVMPRSRTDVLTLLAATAEMADCHPDTPVITMSMGALGAVSRLAGEAFGSAMTFANPGTASAPGQIPLDVVNAALECLKL